MKTFTFVAVWPKRPGQSRPSSKRGVVAAESEQDAERILRADKFFSGVERVCAVEFTAGIEIITCG